MAYSLRFPNSGEYNDSRIQGYNCHEYNDTLKLMIDADTKVMRVPPAARVTEIVLLCLILLGI